MDPADLARLMQLYAAGRKSGDFETGIRRALAGVLASPNFLYRADVGVSMADTAAVRSLTGVELASRLSFFVPGSKPYLKKGTTSTRFWSQEFEAGCSEGQEPEIPAVMVAAVVTGAARGIASGVAHSVRGKYVAPCLRQYV